MTNQSPNIIKDKTLDLITIIDENEDFYFENCIFTNPFQHQIICDSVIENMTFKNCTFKNITFDLEYTDDMVQCCKFIDCKFENVIFSSQIIPKTPESFELCLIENCKFNNCQFNLFAFIDCQISASFYNCQLEDFVIENKNKKISLCCFDKCKLSYTNFDNTNCIYIN